MLMHRCTNSCHKHAKHELHMYPVYQVVRIIPYVYRWRVHIDSMAPILATIVAPTATVVYTALCRSSHGPAYSRGTRQTVAPVRLLCVDTLGISHPRASSAIREQYTHTRVYSQRVRVFQ